MLRDVREAWACLDYLLINLLFVHQICTRILSCEILKTEIGVAKGKFKCEPC